MTSAPGPHHSDDFGVADLFLAGRTDVLGADLDAVFAALGAPASAEELGGATEAMRAFLAVGPGTESGLEPEIAPRVQRVPVRPRAIAAIVVAGTLITGMSAAAYAGALPAPFQDVAHHVLLDSLGTSPRHSAGSATTGRPSAPPSTSAPHRTGEHSAPVPGVTGTETRASDATAPSPEATREGAPSPSGLPSLPPGAQDWAGAYGACTAYTAGHLPTTSSSYGRLVAAAGGADQVGAFCAQVVAAWPHGHATPTPHATSTTHPHATPTPHPTPSSPGHSHDPAGTQPGADPTRSAASAS